MKLDKKMLKISALVIPAIAFTILLFVYLPPVVNKVSADIKAYDTHVAYRDNYKIHTTPLSPDVVHDICSKLDIEDSSENCKPNSVVYAPDLFDEIKAYFRNLPNQDKTYDVVQSKLGAYLDYCEKPNPNGNYVCKYDIRGDGLYPVAFFFDENKMY